MANRHPRNAAPQGRNPRNQARRSNASSSRNNRARGIDDTMISSRLGILLVIFCIFAVILAGRLIWLQVIDAQNNLDRGSSREVTVDLQARRGTIYDRNGAILATTVDAYNIFCHPHVVSSDNVQQLAEALYEVQLSEEGTDTSSEAEDAEDTESAEDAEKKTTDEDSEDSTEEDEENADSDDDSDDESKKKTEKKKTRADYIQEYKDKITSDENFAYLYKGVTEESMQKIKDLGIEGVDFEKTSKRVYPRGATGSQIIGILNSDGDALTGLELMYDDILGGTDGSKTLQYSKEGVPVPGTETVTAEVVNGQDIIVSIDADMQEQLEESLNLRVEEVEGKGGSAILMDSATGEIYACSSSPTFDITDLSKIKDGATNLSGISSAYEPGSIMKPLTMLAALEEGTVTAESKYYCPEVLKVDDFTISDSHSRAAGDLSVQTIIGESSNVGISLVAKDLTFQRLYDYIQQYQLCSTTGVDYPGEVPGYIVSADQWSSAQGYNIAFGQGLTTTPIEWVRFYGALANDGVASTPHFLLEVPAEGQKRSYETTTITQNVDAITDLEGMMQEVVDSGTGTAAQIDGYRVVGKTGTAEIASEEGGYKKGVYNLSFVGYIPDTSTNLVCFVGATDVPGERKTVQAFHDIMAFAIDHYNITQD